MSAIEDYVKRTVDKAPPLAESQRAYLSQVFSGAEPRANAVDYAPAAPLPARCALYRHYDAEDRLLYVGISVNLTARQKDHAKGSAWIEFAERVEAAWFDTVDAAREAERAVIESERPLFNRAHAAADRDEKVFDYLVERGAYHLMRLP